MQNVKLYYVGKNFTIILMSNIYIFYNKFFDELQTILDLLFYCKNLLFEKLGYLIILC